MSGGLEIGGRSLESRLILGTGGFRNLQVMAEAARESGAELATVEDAVLAAGAPDGRGVAVALDGEVVPRGEWATTEVRDGQQVEVLRAVQGGS